MSPLTSWDIAEEGIQRRIALQKDLTRLHFVSTHNKWNTEVQWSNSLLWEDKIIIVTDPALTIIYASENIFAMNGYNQSEVIGHTPRMFQGERTDKKNLTKIRLAVKKKRPFESSIINYKKNGDIYYCHILGYPIFNTKNRLINFIAVENIL